MSQSQVVQALDPKQVIQQCRKQAMQLKPNALFVEFFACFVRNLRGELDRLTTEDDRQALLHALQAQGVQIDDATLAQAESLASTTIH